MPRRSDEPPRIERFGYDPLTDGEDFKVTPAPKPKGEDAHGDEPAPVDPRQTRLGL